MAKAASDKGTVLNSIRNSIENSHPMSDGEVDSASTIEQTDDASASGTSNGGSLGLSIFGSREQVLQLLDTESKRRLQSDPAIDSTYPMRPLFEEAELRAP